MSGEVSIQSQGITWKVPGFSQLTEQPLLSPELHFRDIHYYLKLYPFGTQKLTRSDNIFIYVKRKSLSDPRGDVSCEVGLKTSTGKYIHMYRRTSPRHINTRIFELFLIGRRELMDTRDSCVPDDTLTVLCFMRMGELFYSEQEEESFAQLQWDYGQLLEEEADTDTCLVVSEKEFRVHRCVLRARSTVFNAMFGHETAEKEKGQVVINDLNPDSFAHFLEYLYTGGIQAGLSDDIVFDMYKAADKYDVPTLKSECVAHMLRTMSVDSFCEVKTLTLWHSEKDLQQKVIEFFKDNMRRIIVTPKWQQFIDCNGVAANELFIQALVPLEK